MNKSRVKRSPIWSVSKEELQAIIDKSKSVSEVLSHFNLMNKGGNYKTLKSRLDADDIDLSDIKKRDKEYKRKLLKDMNKSRPLSEILVENSDYNRYNLKIRLVKEGLLEYRCAKCGLTDTWNNDPISLQIDHINGIFNDNRLENLRFLCPNCHSQTETFSAKRNKKPDPTCLICGKKIYKGSRLCVKCNSIESAKRNTKVVDKPDYEALKNLLKEHGYTGVGRMYNVSDNAVRKWLERYEKS